jgi:hypothetical protein
MRFSSISRCLVILVLTLFPLQSAASDPPAASAASTFEEYSTARADVVSMIAGSTKRVFLTSDFLTDADIVTSLYIAQYRKVQIHVLIGREKASHVMSRLGYLKQVNIQTGFRPPNFFAKYPSVVLIDDSLFTFTTTFDYMSRAKKIVKTKLGSSEQESYEKVFAAALKSEPIPDPKPLPQVGRAGKSPNRTSNVDRTAGKPIRTGDSSSTATSTSTQESQESQNAPEPTLDKKLSNSGSYRYKSIKDRPNNGIPTKLPKTTIYQQREQERKQHFDSSPQATNTPSE